MYAISEFYAYPELADNLPIIKRQYTSDNK